MLEPMRSFPSGYRWRNDTALRSVRDVCSAFATGLSSESRTIEQKSCRSDLIESFERDGPKLQPDNRLLPIIALLIRSRYHLNRDEYERAEDCLSKAEATSRDSQAWYLGAIQAALIHQRAPDESRAQRAIADLRKAVDAGFQNRSSVEKERAFQCLRNRDDFGAIFKRLKNPA